MMAKALSTFPHAWLSCLAMGLFFAVFAGAVWWAVRPACREFHRKLSELPLQE